MSAPTKPELAELCALVSADEWRRLVVHLPFLAATTRSIEETRSVMKKFLGRDPASQLVKPHSQDSDL